jgi:phospholipid/cholesterol/gamma-HCH transport system substrate-binding protein
MVERFKFRHVNEITGTLVLVVVAVLIATVVWTGHSQRWFRSNVPLRIVLPEAGAAGIRQGSEVYFLGTLVGTVSYVEVDENGGMEAQTRIRRDFFRFVRTDSSAVVKKTFGVAGDSFFEITRGEGQPLPQKNASIICKEQFQSALEAAVEEIRSQATLVMKKTSAGLETWTQLGADLGETRQHLDQLAGRLENIAAGVEAGNGTVGKLITETTLADEAQHILAQANEVMSGLEGVGTSLNATAKNMQDGTARLPEIADAVADEAEELPGLREIERLVEAMQRHWLLRKYVNKTNPPPLHPPYEPAVPGKKPFSVLRSPKDSER